MKDDTYGVRAVERAVGVLAALAASETPQTLTEIATRVGLSVTTTFRLLRTLQAQRLAHNNEHGRYTLGARILEFGHAYVRQLDIIAIARPFLVAARNRVNETVGLAVRSGDAWVPITSVQAMHQIRRVMQPGEPTPLYASGIGKLLLSGEPEAEIEAYIARTQMVPFSATTITDPDTMRSQIHAIRQRGYAVSMNERGAGGVGISAPIFDHEGTIVAAMTIGAPVSRYTPEVGEACIAAALEAARGISAALGFHGASARPTDPQTTDSQPAHSPLAGSQPIHPVPTRHDERVETEH
jgi:DNA-binding IclR family transcriptional regulator